MEHSGDDKYPEVSFPASNRSFFRQDRERSLSLFLVSRLFERSNAEEKTREKGVSCLRFYKTQRLIAFFGLRCRRRP